MTAHTAGPKGTKAEVAARAVADRAEILALYDERAALRAQRDELAATIRHIDGVAAFKAATGRDSEAWESVLAFTRAALAKVTP